jgi:beta-glucanase (GH16 family)
LATPTASAAAADWRLTFEDTFDGTALDPTKWVNETYWRSWLPERQLYLPQNVRVEQGLLRLETRRQDTTYQGHAFAYTSGYVSTRGKFVQRYGKFEVRARLPKGQGIWPAHWLLPQNGDWPPEIDIMELLGHDPATVYVSNHWGTPADHQYRTQGVVGPDFSSDFHTFAVEWEPGALRWLVDGVVRDAMSSRVPDVPMYLILNTAVGGTWPGDPNATTALPQVHEVDYVRVYRRAVP